MIAKCTFHVHSRSAAQFRPASMLDGDCPLLVTMNILSENNVDVKLYHLYRVSLLSKNIYQREFADTFISWLAVARVVTGATQVYHHARAESSPR